MLEGQTTTSIYKIMDELHFEWNKPDNFFFLIFNFYHIYFLMIIISDVLQIKSSITTSPLIG